MVELSVRSMTKVEYERWRSEIDRRFADSQVAAGTWQPERALELARQGNDTLLPEGLATDGSLLLIAERPDGTPVGRLWIGLTHPRGTVDCAFLYDIEVRAEHRGRGYGRALLAAAEAAVRERGISALELNVFGDNQTAIALYAGSGYAVVTQQMRKDLTAG
ncbi:GNAT family N-acetyltransferase [Solwaraspora sp. WMMD1047]|uniref:GNAT family N-acetyltransferase n=1 Tax=Solwaraspora sp. WMMD1047 TaxID=3016102 RepID=UPI0024178BD8|nr:GNAT family N-acetyltransferase [Solwaraspora sp. WMMD1047]MDG4831481.1 GNAT family N-acetyltransferase [Solwaraspora sp. WMMD1047]